MKLWCSAVAMTVVGLLVAACDNGAGGSGDSGFGGPKTPATGCAKKAPTAPNGYWVNGNTVCTPDGKPHLFHGVDRPSMEWANLGDHLSLKDFKLMGDGNYPADPAVKANAWHANVVRVALNQDWWLNNAIDGTYSASYADLVDQVVQWAEESGMDVILDLHWSDKGDFTVKAAQQYMADAHSLQFWKEVASIYKNDGRVLFELYNEPHDIGTDVWLKGGNTGAAGYTAVGMQALYDAVRATGANNLVIAGGLNYAYDLSFASQYPINGYNVMYATHPYNNDPSRAMTTWGSSWGFLTNTAPVIITEFGDTAGACDPTWDTDVIGYADQHRASWTAWAWYVAGNPCTFPTVISDWEGTPNEPGKVVKKALLGYTDPAFEPARPMPPEPDAGPTDDGGASDAGPTADGGSPDAAAHQSSPDAGDAG